MAFWNRRRNKSLITFDDMLKDLTGFHSSGTNSLKELSECFEGMKTLVTRLKMDTNEFECKRCRKYPDHSRQIDDSRQVEELKNQNLDLKNEIDRLKSTARRESNDIRGSNESELERKTTRIKQLESDLDDLRKGKKKLEDSIRRISEELSSFEHDLTEEFENTQSFGSPKARQSEEYSTDVDLTISRRLAILRAKHVEGRNDTKKNLESLIRDNNKRREELQREKDYYKRDSEAKADGYQKLLKKSLDESEVLMKRIEDLETEVQTSYDRHKVFQQTCDGLGQIIQDRDKECKNLELKLPEIESLRSSLTSVEEELAITKRESHEKQEKCRELKNQLLEVRIELDDNRQKYNGICKQLDSEKSSSSAFRGQLSEEQNKVRTLKNDNDKLKSETDALRLQIDELQKKWHESVHDCKMAQVEYLEEPWLELDDINWDRESLENLRREVEEYAPLKDQGVCEDKIQYVNILMLGPVGAGKSSFFNTVNSFFKTRLAIRARAGSSNTSLTKTFDVYKVKDSLRFRLCDCRGLEEAQGLDNRDIEAILDGHVMDGYVFNANTYVTKENPKYNRNPTIADRIHCVVFVVDGSSHSDMIMSEKVLEQNRRLQEIMNTKRIPQLILLTKMDVINSAFKKELPKVFYSQNVCEIVKKVAGTLGLPPCSVLPMLNLANSQKVSHDISVLTLYNLRQMLRACDDFLDNFVDELMSGQN